MTEPVEIKNDIESKCSIKIETNSKGHNTTVHVYEGITFQEIDDTVDKAMYAHSNVQNRLSWKDKTHCQKCGEWLVSHSICSERGFGSN